MNLLHNLTDDESGLWVRGWVIGFSWTEQVMPMSLMRWEWQAGVYIYSGLGDGKTRSKL